MDLKGPVTDEMLEELRAKNIAQAKAKIAEMGDRWVMSKDYTHRTNYRPLHTRAPEAIPVSLVKRRVA